MGLQKISFRVPPGLWQAFALQANQLFLSRAPFLDHMIARETPHLAEDLAGRKLSVAAKRHISGMLKKEGAQTASVNIEVTRETATALNQIIRDSNIVRDAFICRLIIFLRGSDSLLKNLGVPLEVKTNIHGSGHITGLEAMPSSPLKAMEAVRDDPLYYIREHVTNNWGTGIYTVQLPRALDWAACFIEDKDVPGTEAYKVDQRLSAEMFALLERDAFANEPLIGRKDDSK